MNSPIISILVLFALSFVVICEEVYIPHGENSEYVWKSDYYPNKDNLYYLQAAEMLFKTSDGYILSFKCDMRTPWNRYYYECYEGVHMVLQDGRDGNIRKGTCGKYSRSDPFTFKSKSSSAYGIVSADKTFQRPSYQRWRCFVTSIPDPSSEATTTEPEATTSEPEATTSEPEPTTSKPEATTEPGNPPSSSCECGKPSINRIVGGQDADRCEYFYQAGLFVDYGSGQTSNVFCGASIISSTIILTAAHCIFDTTPYGLLVKVGDYDYTNGNDDTEQSHGVNKIIVHPEYNTDTLDNDIALIFLETPIDFNDCVAPICLPFNSIGAPDAALGNLPVTVSGWGTTSTGGTQSEILQEVDITTVDNTICGGKYGSSVNPNTMICAAGPGQDSCQGDSGGPLSYDLSGTIVQVGIVSWGINCADPDYPGIYTYLQQYTEWITDNSNDVPC